MPVLVFVILENLFGEVRWVPMHSSTALTLGWLLQHFFVKFLVVDDFSLL